MNFSLSIVGAEDIRVSSRQANVITVLGALAKCPTGVRIIFFQDWHTLVRNIYRDDHKGSQNQNDLNLA